MCGNGFLDHISFMRQRDKKMETAPPSKKIKLAAEIKIAHIFEKRKSAPDL